jgi:hypothetical protein
MNGPALFYPFHLCSRETLEHLLARYAVVHFRDYMALQLTPMSGTTAFLDRMSDHCPDLYGQGRIVQGHSVSGPVSAETGARIDRDLADREWRQIFHSALQYDRVFQRGFTGLGVDETAVQWRHDHWQVCPVSLAEVRQRSCLKLDADLAAAFEYGMMLVKTSAALWYSIQLCQQHTLEAATDSAVYDRLLKRILIRERLQLPTYLCEENVPRHGPSGRAPVA